MLTALMFACVPVAGIALIAAIERRLTASSPARLGRRLYVDPMPPLPIGETVWAWRGGVFERARIQAVRAGEPRADGGNPIYRVSFPESGSTDEVEIPACQIRTGSERPESLAGHDWHRLRRQGILRQHPGMLELKATNPAVYPAMMLAAILIHLSVGAGIARHAQSPTIGLWAVLLAATVGAFCAYALQQLTHESCHTQHRRITRFLALVGDLTLGTSGPNFYVYYYQYHIPHHAHTGDAGDPDITMHGHWAVVPKWAARTRIGRFLWLSLFAIFTFEILVIEHLIGRIPQPRMTLKNRRLVILLLAKYAGMGLAFALGGIWCLLYFRLAAAFSLGAFGHPYAGFWLMQHLSVARNGFQPTVSYAGSGIWNWLTLGELYHVEHHDFPWIPLTRIRDVRRIAPEYYRDLCVVPSVWRLTWEWISHTDGTPWMDVAGALDCMRSGPARDRTHRAAPEVLAPNAAA